MRPEMRTRQPLRVLVAKVAAMLLLFAALNAATAQANTSPTQTGNIPKCSGMTATIVGVKGQATVRGTPGPDVIFSRWDDQSIYGLGGDDRLCGHANIFGGRGDDQMSVRGEKAFLDMSVLKGGRGNDHIVRNEALSDDPHFELPTYGGPGDDELHGGPNLNLLSGGPGHDLLFGGDLNDTIRGGSGRDDLNGVGGDDHLSGGAGPDIIFGGHMPGVDDMDVAVGGGGIDWCYQVEVHDCEHNPDGPLGAGAGGHPHPRGLSQAGPA